MSDDEEVQEQDAFPPCPTCKKPMTGTQVVGDGAEKYEGPGGTANPELILDSYCENPDCPDSGAEMARVAGSD